MRSLPQASRTGLESSPEFRDGRTRFRRGGYRGGRKVDGGVELRSGINFSSIGAYGDDSNLPRSEAKPTAAW